MLHPPRTVRQLCSLRQSHYWCWRRAWQARARILPAPCAGERLFLLQTAPGSEMSIQGSWEAWRGEGHLRGMFPWQCTVGRVGHDLACGMEGHKELLLQKGGKPVFPLHAADLQNPLLQKQKVLDAFNGISVKGRKQRGLRDPETFALTQSGALSGSPGPCRLRDLFQETFFFQ